MLRPHRSARALPLYILSGGADGLNGVRMSFAFFGHFFCLLGFLCAKYLKIQVFVKNISKMALFSSDFFALGVYLLKTYQK